MRKLIDWIVEILKKLFPENETAQFLLNNWKLGTHLVFHTKRFGVNNEWWSQNDSVIGWETKDIVWGVLTVKPIVVSLKAMLIRAFCLGLMAPEERVKIIPLVRFLAKFIDLKPVVEKIEWTKQAVEMNK